MEGGGGAGYIKGWSDIFFDLLVGGGKGSEINNP